MREAGAEAVQVVIASLQAVGFEQLVHVRQLGLRLLHRRLLALLLALALLLPSSLHARRAVLLRGRALQVAPEVELDEAAEGRLHARHPRRQSRQVRGRQHERLGRVGCREASQRVQMQAQPMQRKRTLVEDGRRDARAAQADLPGVDGRVGRRSEAAAAQLSLAPACAGGQQ